MRLLLDTNILILLARNGLGEIDRRIGAALLAPENLSFASAASFWEIAIKTRIGKLESAVPLDALAGFFQAMGVNHLVIDHRHAVAAVEPEPTTRDPFDRLLLAQCKVEGMRLVTADRALNGHPLAWQAAQP
jgi:PIN domain nuclease of toxin-antitoxin system